MTFSVEIWLPARQAGRGSGRLHDDLLIAKRAFLPDEPARGRKKNVLDCYPCSPCQHQLFDTPGQRPMALTFP